MVTRAELAELQREPNWADTDEAPAWLAVEGVEALSGAWIRAQPIPVIDVAGRSALADVWVDGEEDLAVVAAAVERNPEASAALVQVLRAGEQLNGQEALAVESLAYATLQGGQEYRRWFKAQPSRSLPGDVREPVRLARDGQCLIVTLNVPERRNALSGAVRDGLSEAFKLVLMDGSIAEVSVQGSWPSFCSGGDLAEFGEVSDTAEKHNIRSKRMPAQYLIRCADRCTFYLHGACVGAGIELPAFAARVVARSDTTLRLPEIGMGLIPGAGGCVSIPRRIGRQRTAWMALSGEAIDAHTALDWGLIDEMSDA